MKTYYTIFIFVLICLSACNRENDQKEHVKIIALENGDLDLVSKETLLTKINPDIELSELANYVDQVRLRKKLKQTLEGGQKTDNPDKFAEYLRERKTPLDKQRPEYLSGYLESEYQRAKLSMPLNRSADGVTFQERGPNNISGRSRSMLIDESDSTGNTWIAAAVGGGIWKTTDGGQSWNNLSADLPNLSISALAWSESNRDIIYAGTGEFNGNPVGINGDGVFKSSDGGNTWESVVDPNTYPNFATVTRLIVHKENPDIVLATAVAEIGTSINSSSVYKSVDGGATWEATLSVDGIMEDLDVSPFDPDYIIASHTGNGLYISEDGGDTWTLTNDGIRETVQRMEVAASTIDSTRWWISAHVFRGQSILMVSNDKGKSWQEVRTDWRGSELVDFLDQGEYDNAITTHPFDNDVVYVGGVSAFKFSIGEDFRDTTSFFTVEENGSEEFMSFINFGGVPGNGFVYGSNVNPEDLPDIEVRFGQGGQLAYRFTVGGRGAGVPASEYQYEDYVMVPFQVWDITNDRQLMLSFRDQAENGVYDLIPRNTSGDPLTHSREYMSLHLVDYSETIDTNIAKDGGFAYQQAYNNWPVSGTNDTIDLTAVASSNFQLLHKSVMRLSSITEPITDGTLTGTYNGVNSSYIAAYLLGGIGNHPDHHFIYSQVVNADSSTFRLILANDGGVHVSEPSTNPGTAQSSIRFAGRGYLTTQVMSADKAPGEDRFIGGAIDNSVWYTLDTVDGSGIHDFRIITTGDGFDSYWNNVRSNVIWTCTQFNRMIWSPDGGERWFLGTNGLTDGGAGSAPFITKVVTSKAMPEQMYAVGTSGIWKADYYGFDNDFWELVVPDNWLYAGSFTQINVSNVDPKVVVAGGVLSESNGLFVSTDGGESFEQTGTYSNATLGGLSGLEMHPTNSNILYSLFSFAGRPKVLRSTDLGENWEDISGFENNSGVSINGFPDVAVNALFVFPNNTDRIWAGTEIGIVESLDNGVSWNLLDSEIGAAPVWEFKLQDDQIVISTIGRGIWTAAIENFQNDLVLYPDVFSVNVDPFGGDDTIIINAQQAYDSLFVFLNDVGGSLGPITAPGLLSLPTTPFGEYPEKDNTVTLIGFVNGQAHVSLPYRFDNILIPDTVITSYFNDFSSIEASLIDFKGEGFVIESAEGFDGNGIQSPHPYVDGTELIYQLIYPIAIEDQVLAYEDVALIEPGDSGTVFGDRNFWDFVIVEGLAKGTSDWVPLFDGYDARDKGAWLDAYNNGTSGSQDLLGFHSVNLTDVFETGDTILLRFRLSADAATVGWGWFIDYINIESITTDVEEIEESELLVYPNPVVDELTIQAPSDLRAITVFDMTGKQVFTREYERFQDLERIDMSNYPTGTYLVRIKTDESEEVKKIIVQ